MKVLHIHRPRHRRGGTPARTAGATHTPPSRDRHPLQPRHRRGLHRAGRRTGPGPRHDPQHGGLRAAAAAPDRPHGQERQRLEETARDAGVAEHVVFAGERRDVGPVLSSFDLLVAASAQETFGLAMLEALGTGLPLLYTTCPALDGIVTDLARQVPGEEGHGRPAPVG